MARHGYSYHVGYEMTALYQAELRRQRTHDRAARQVQAGRADDGRELKRTGPATRLGRAIASGLRGLTRRGERADGKSLAAPVRCD